MHDDHPLPPPRRLGCPIEECPILHARAADGPSGCERRHVHPPGRPGARRSPTPALRSRPRTGVEGCVVVFEDISERKAHEDAPAARGRQARLDRADPGCARPRTASSSTPSRSSTWAPARSSSSELLLRMRDADGRDRRRRGRSSTIAEQYGLIGDIDRWVIERGDRDRRQRAAGRDQPLAPLGR